MEEKSVRFSFQARYCKEGIIHADTRQVWIVLHGYGQLAPYFIKKFQPLLTHDVCVIAPEGLSRFYLSELTESGRKDNKVGATWMTRENRAMDIDNYIIYLDTVYHQELKDFPSTPVTIFGFSQGCATACRWATHGKIKFERLVLWAGLFPPDMDFSVGKQVLANKKTFLVVGDQDPFVNEERKKEFDALALQLGITPEKIDFPGKHEINADILLKLVT